MHRGGGFGGSNVRIHRYTYNWNGILAVSRNCIPLCFWVFMVTKHNSIVYTNNSLFVFTCMHTHTLYYHNNLDGGNPVSHSHTMKRVNHRLNAKATATLRFESNRLCVHYCPHRQLLQGWQLAFIPVLSHALVHVARTLIGLLLRAALCTV